MMVYVWTLSVALAVMVGVAIKYKNQADGLAQWIQANHPEDLEK